MSTRTGATVHKPERRAPRTRVLPSRFRYSWLIVALVSALVLFVRIRLRAVPLERDEGEFAYIGQLILKGIPPYSIAYSMKLPGVYLAYALILSVFGQSASGVHLGFALVNVATIVLVFMLCRRLVDDWAGMVAAAAYGVMSLSPSVLGTSAHATHFVVLPALGALLLLATHLPVGPARDDGDRRARRNTTSAAFAGAGALLGIAFLMKQPGVLFLLCGIAWILVLSRFQVRMALGGTETLVLAAAVPVGLIWLWLAASGVLDTFWFWVFTYARAYASELPIDLAGGAFALGFVPIFQAAPLIWILAAAGSTVPLWDRAHRLPGILLLILLLCSAVAVSLTFYFRAHYFVLALPAVAMLGGAATSALIRLSYRITGLRVAALPALTLAAFAVVMPVNHDRHFLFAMTPTSASRFMYGGNPFPESMRIADYIRRNSRPEDRTAIFGSEPQIYFYADRLSATGYIYTYGLMEAHPYALAMQRQMIREVKAAKPKFVVFVSVGASWLRQPTSRKEILDWGAAYVRSAYHLVGWVDLPQGESGEGRYYWGRQALGRRLLGSEVLIYERGP